ncbi:MAG: AraC family transcriptional regulator [Bacteroidetes bacterium]|uniref:Helix-turn-helix transcriptional regulator n=1 Tax=Phaeocystidibacter marisrubri TaxID=1577780 RepID=A0A6L3ZC83_9FLAO|nr:AraC family transcriptional regulator [Phaeocystidibacter marisrubri]KAB2815246.1 helix-turn-helix transcriptional regulator [Phaeocystidibacter marisrubri]TNE27273.1 MAG: AraC family transcriptional regulator [Bacteroidota bacterium]GGH71094.1 AraC family transcriptional regulator [Phaeocystidibacter marisrubri]
MKVGATEFKSTEDPENIAERSRELIRVSEGITLVKIENDGSEPFVIQRDMPKSVIQFYFALEGQSTFKFGPTYQLQLQEGKNFFFYNPEKELPVNITVNPGAKHVFLFLTIDRVHELFVEDAAELPFLSSENINRKFYDERQIASQTIVVLNQLFNTHLSPQAQKLFYKGKVYELLSFYFSAREVDTVSCPFLNDEDNVRKIKLAKEFLMKNMANPPSIKDLAREVGLNEYRLKVGFKEVYGNTVYGYLLDHKMDHSRSLLDSGKYKVNEVAYALGYTNPSHFITAFKKKFGITPKKYLSNE